MEEEISFEMESAKEAMEKALARLDNELTKVRAGRANASMLSQVFVDYYGSKTPLSQIGNISAPDAKTLVVQPWEKGMLDADPEVAMQAIFSAKFGSLMDG